ncbi:larval cuticle protein 65Ag1 [Cephus cinctus]|uniref:Larval cuticle protein 65Ag1 n=1 Tax=Cephus cinctus TaxID=211228 RepID=A0AAJ7FHG6_CEPCN|nr:larval cuticle protein 65Ag1 [Cephus cinctus]
MKTIIAFVALVVVAFAAPQGQSDVVVVNEDPLDNIGIDGYKYGYELSNGESKQESAQVKNVGTENEAIQVTGSFSWIDPVTGQKFQVDYVADENGFQPQGAHIPV